MTAPLCFVDTETDGVHPGRKPWEVALIRRDPNGTETTEHFYLSIDLSTADPFGLRIGGFYDRHPMGRRLSGATGPKGSQVRPITSAAPLIARMTHEAHIVGAVPNFDTEILERLLRENGLTPAWHYHLIDIENLAVGYLNGRGAGAMHPPWSSDAITAALGLPPVDEKERHTALGDARWAMHVYDTVLAARPQEAVA
jgi:hypothetical protein